MRPRLEIAGQSVMGDQIRISGQVAGDPPVLLSSVSLQAAGFNDIPYVYDCFGSPDKGTVVNQEPSGGQVALATPIRLQLQANNC